MLISSVCRYANIEKIGQEGQCFGCVPNTKFWLEIISYEKLAYRVMNRWHLYDTYDSPLLPRSAKSHRNYT